MLGTYGASYPCGQTREVDLPSACEVGAVQCRRALLSLIKQAFSLQHTQLQQLFICCVSAPPSKPASFVGDGSERTYGTVTRQVVQGVCSVVLTHRMIRDQLHMRDQLHTRPILFIHTATHHHQRANGREKLTSERQRHSKIRDLGSCAM